MVAICLKKPQVEKSAWGFSGYEPYTADVNTGVDTNKIVSLNTLSYMAGEEFLYSSTGGNSQNSRIFSSTTALVKRLERVRGQVRYELKNFRGDVRQVISDVKYREEVNGVVEYTADVWQVEDSYPFGWSIKDRSFTHPNPDEAYRFGFNGKENNEEISNGNQDFGARFYDSKIGRWWGVDPLAHQYRSYTPYNFAGNSPISMIDPDGKRITWSNSPEAQAVKAQVLALVKESEIFARLYNYLDQLPAEELDFHVVVGTFDSYLGDQAEGLVMLNLQLVMFKPVGASSKSSKQVYGEEFFHVFQSHLYGKPAKDGNRSVPEWEAEAKLFDLILLGELKEGTDALSVETTNPTGKKKEAGINIDAPHPFFGTIENKWYNDSDITRAQFLIFNAIKDKVKTLEINEDNPSMLKGYYEYLDDFENDYAEDPTHPYSGNQRELIPEAYNQMVKGISGESKNGK